MEKIELLAPAGDYNCFLAAMNAGADAVYLSGEKYGARAYAKNFTKEELVKAIDYAHLFDKKVFLTVNTLLKDDELSELYEYLIPYYEAGLDGVIVQDMGVISYIRRTFPDMPVHASTQLAITGVEGIQMLEKLGVKRTVLARELTMDEIIYIKNNSEMELETFVHGALCYSYSGKCLFSSLVGGRSGNRGRCAGSCRQPYNEKYLLSTKDICCLPLIPNMIEAGIASLKIEGRMKSPEYVAGVTAVYRKYIDIFYANINSMSVSDIREYFFSGKSFFNDLNTLTKLYTRGGNSTGYYYKHNGKDMITIEDASYKSDKGEVKAQINDIYVSNSKKISLSCMVRIAANENMSILINNEFYYEGGMASVAKNNPLDEDTVRKQLLKTKDTEFEFTEIEFNIDNNSFARISDINRLRRESLDQYKEYLLSKFRRNSSKYSDIIFSDSINVNEDLSVNCEISKYEQLNAVLEFDSIEGIYIPFEIIKKYGIDLVNKIKCTGKKVYIKFQSVIRYNYLKKNKDIIYEAICLADGALADSHELLQFLKTVDYKGTIIGDIHIYCLNNEAQAKYVEIGINKTTVPIELSRKELLRRNIKGEELLVYGYLPMMLSAQCVNKTVNSCDKNHKELSLKDRKNIVFSVVNNCETCHNIVYNNVPLSLHDELELIKKIKPASVRISFTLEDENRVKDVLKVYSHIFDNFKSDNCINKDIVASVFKQNTYTKGHLNRGVL